ncbi:MAG: prolyl oligopeptidase family serine peptidase [Actinomycetaceae bacterium]|nr:prolyl oligopeptidase family serine peptidase [Actinomycetaceae bacterium]
MTENEHFQFLDEPTSAEALKWVTSHNVLTLEQLETEQFKAIRTDVLAALEDPDRIPFPRIRDQWAYNFWTDDDNPRGLWRRQLSTDYLGIDTHAQQQWEILIDVDQLAEAEDRSWVWHGAAVCYPNNTRALVTLSDGGSDTDTVREFDIHTRQFVEDGFTLPPSKGSVSWINEDEVWVSRDFGESTLTESGYPRQVRRWRRGTKLSDAPIVYEAEKSDVLAVAAHDSMPGWERDWIVRIIDFHNQEVFLLDTTDGVTLHPIDCPTHVHTSSWRDWLLFLPKKEWQIGENIYPAGSLLVAPLEDYMAGHRDVHVLFAPTPTTALEDITPTRHHLVLNVLDDVANRLTVFTPPNDKGTEWTQHELAFGSFEGEAVLPPFASVSVGAVNAYEEDRIWLTTTGFTTPTTLSLVELSRSGHAVSARQVRQAPTLFDSTGITVSQHFVASADGTRVPYFQIGPTDTTTPRPTLLYGYGGFEVSLTPSYLATAGKAWLERGGVYVIANIRGGGEYGPSWHHAALKDQRHRAYEDFAAVARDLVDRGVTTRAQLGAQGGSNGGLLIGMMLTQYPELFGALVCQVPLLDMRRYHTLLAGASWMAEYGDPDDPEQWEYIRTFSPFHLFDSEREYPPTLFTTSTRDDRVHPAHARHMFRQMADAGKDVLLYENIEGGHAGAADHKQRATMAALAWEFLWQKLGTSPKI